MGKNPTIADVAARAGVSTATVSRVINKTGFVQDPTRESVERAVEELSYTPSFAGRSLASNRSNTIGVIIPTMSNAIFALFIETLQEELTEQGYTLLVATSRYSAQQEARHIDAFIGRGVDGLVLIGASRDEAIHARLAKRDIPTLLMWINGHPDCVTIGFDNVATSQSATQRVLALGHLHIGILSVGAVGNDRAAARIEGVMNAVKAQGDATFILAESDYDIATASAVVQKMLSAPDRPTAIICGNDVLAAGAVLGARACGLRVPDDVSVLGFDDIQLALAIDPPLTTVRVPHRRMARAACAALMKWISDGTRPQNVIFQTEIIERATLAPPPVRV